MTDVSNYWEDCYKFFSRYPSIPGIDKNTIISTGTELRILGFYPDIRKTDGQYTDTTLRVLIIRIGKSEFKIEKKYSRIRIK
jgi:hypothetical protein